jgi:hypothetical protein
VSNLVVIDHPLVAHKLSLMRDKTMPSAQFRSPFHGHDRVACQGKAFGYVPFKGRLSENSR